MSRIAYVNGRYVAQRQACVSIEDRGYQFGDGIYEVIHVHGGRFVDAELHLARFARSMREISLTPPMSMEALRPVLAEILRRNRVRDGLVYMQVTRGVARRDHKFPPPSTRPAFVITAKHGGAFPRDIKAWACDAITLPDLRWARCDIKSVNLLPNVLAREEARRQGAYEAILIDGAGGVTEGAATSVWMVDGEGRLRTRQLDQHILPGCTRESLKALLGESRIGFAEEGFSAEALRGAAEIFLTSATSFVKPVTRLDGRKVGDGRPGPVTRRLFEMFTRHVEGAAHNLQG
ncbi:MAG TPA: D-amino-acid transaminase [Acetobacteraceae bacterium]|nr:D-amino-acid transaminase [Acetobacteraceae bacterium]